MKQHKLLKKLLDQHCKHGSIIVAYDFDDTVYPFNLEVEELKDTVNLIQKLAICGHKVYCYTSNEDIEKLQCTFIITESPIVLLTKALLEMTPVVIVLQGNSFTMSSWTTKQD